MMARGDAEAIGGTFPVGHVSESKAGTTRRGVWRGGGPGPETGKTRAAPFTEVAAAPVVTVSSRVLKDALLDHPPEG